MVGRVAPPTWSFSAGAIDLCPVRSLFSLMQRQNIHPAGYGLLGYPYRPKAVYMTNYDPKTALRSMTGFATQSGAMDPFRWAWDIRSVNGKGLDLRLRVPDWVDGLEAAS